MLLSDAHARVRRIQTGHAMTTDQTSSESKEIPKRRRWLRRLVRMFVLYLIVSGIGLGVLWYTGYAERLAYMPVRDAFETPEGYEDVWIESVDGTRLHGWLMPAITARNGEPSPAILHVHGNAGNVMYHESFSAFLTNAGFHVLLFDYRGYGRSDEGKISRGNLSEDTRAALAYLMARDDVDPNRVGVLGVSLGGVFALDAVVNEPEVKAVATLSAFSSWRGVAKDMAGAGSLLIRPGLDPEDLARELGTRPYMIMHGTGDQIVDPRHADRLRQAAEDSFVMVTQEMYPGDHNSLIQYNLQAQRDLIVFYEKYLGVSND